MWSSRRALRNAVMALGAVAALGLAGCTSFTPVYGERGASVEQYALNYAKPSNRLDQIIYQELAFRLGRSNSPTDPTVRVTTSFALRDLTVSAVRRPSQPNEAAVTATIELIGPDGKLIFSARRSATAEYMSNNQALAETEAERDALERAAKALAETIRLTLIGALDRPVA